MPGAQERTEKPTQKRRDDTRRRGRVPRSREATGLAVVLGGCAAAYGFSGSVYGHFRELFAASCAAAFRLRGDAPGAATEALGVAVSHGALMAAPILGVAVVCALLFHALQAKGFAFSLDPVKPKLSALNPLEGLKKLFSARSLVEAAKSLAKVVLIGWAAWSAASSHLAPILSLAGADAGAVATAAGGALFSLLVRVGVVMALLSFLDYAWQKHSHTRDIMMTKQEVKEEHKQSEGNPQIKARIRSIQKTLARRRMMSDVKKADVVITNPTHYAVALLYAHGMDAPRVIAKGRDILARRIIETARKHGRPVVENPPLARALYRQVGVNETIPAALYRAVARVLAYIYQRRGPAGGGA